MDEKWIKHLLALRQHKAEQLEYLATHDIKFQQTTDGVTTDVTADWVRTLQREHAEISQLLTEEGVQLDA